MVKEISWEDFGQMLMSLEHLQFKLEISDRSDEVWHVLCNGCRCSLKAYRRIVMPGVWRGALAVVPDFAFIVQSLSSSQPRWIPLEYWYARIQSQGLIDALLLKLPSVSPRKIGGLDAYFVRDKMFACFSGSGVGLRLPATTATELQFSRADVAPFQPGGMASMREWVQIDRANAAEYEQDLELFQASLEFVKAAQPR
jgi:hypothetical protein